MRRTTTPSRPKASSSCRGTARSFWAVSWSCGRITPRGSAEARQPFRRFVHPMLRPLRGASMPVRFRLLQLLPVLLAAPLAAQGGRYTLSGSNIAVYNLAGEMRVEAGSGSAVVVEVTRRGPDGSKLEVQTGAIDSRQTLRVIYPGDRVVYPVLGRHSQSQVRVNDDGTFDGRRGREVTIAGDGSGVEASADLRVLVPAG